MPKQDWIDDVARGLATGWTRRQALKAIGSGLLGAAMAAIVPPPAARGADPTSPAATDRRATSSGSMRGFADIHNHQFANLAFGGNHVVGAAYGPIEQSLNSADDFIKHGPNHTLDLLGGAIATHGPNVFLYGHEGAPSFAHWPQFWQVTHQTVHQDQLYRALQGGLRLMVMLAVDSPVLCENSNNDGRPCFDETSTINVQLNAAYDMQEYIDEQSGGPGTGWYRIVKNPSEARQVIHEGKLAVVLGVETAHLAHHRNCIDFGCPWLETFRTFWQMGARHFFPIHQADNLFGAAAYFSPMLQRQTNWLGDTWKVVEAPYEMHTRPCGYGIERCNSNGLTDTGRQLIEELIRAGGIIDIDHMSERSVADTFDIVGSYDYPITASHAGFHSINRGEQNHEGQRTADQLNRIHQLGGMVGLITNQGTLAEVETNKRPGKHTIPHVCGRTTETFSQAYYFALDNAPGMPIAVGTDFNGQIIQVGPRFGTNQCFSFLNVSEPPYFNRDFTQTKNEKRLEYRFLARGSYEMLDRHKFGDRIFDFNEDGLSHVGMLPDMFADLEVLGVSAEDLEPLFNSAEGYVLMWERAIDGSRRTMRKMEGLTSPEILILDAPLTFRITAVDRYSRGMVLGDVYFNGEHVGKTGESVTRTFASTVKSRCHYDPELRRVVCDEYTTGPSVRVKIVAADYFDHSFDLRYSRDERARADDAETSPQAAFVSQVVPSVMIAGQQYNASITMRNTGESSWTLGGEHPYSLGAQSPQDNTNWGHNRVALPQIVSPGQEVTFTFAVHPYFVGQYEFEWQMVLEGITWFGDKTTKRTVEVRELDRAEFVSQEFPPEFVIGGINTVMVTMRNTGNSTWTAGEYWLALESGRGPWGAIQVTPPGPVAPGLEVTFSFAVGTPSSPGTHGFPSLRMVHKGQFFGDPTPSVDVNVSSNPRDHATFISQTVPAEMIAGRMVAGRQYQVSVKMRNTGFSTWTEGPNDYYRLGSWNPRSNTSWGTNRVFVPAAVLPGQEVTFTFMVTTPTNPGMYNFQWRLLREGNIFFGEPTQNMPVTVTAR
jgi:microsomal dipeptidase-like Zn-dependent dipeptidase